MLRDRFIAGCTGALCAVFARPAGASPPMNALSEGFQIAQLDFTGNVPMSSGVMDGSAADWTAGEKRVNYRGDYVPVGALFVAGRIPGINVTIERVSDGSSKNIQLAAFASASDVLGSSSVVDISFDVNRKIVSVAFPAARLTTHKVSTNEVSHSWCWRESGGPWQPLLDIKAVIFVGLDDVSFPWSRTYSPSDGAAIAEFEAVQLAAYWADGAKDAAGVIGAITVGVASLGGVSRSELIKVDHVQYTTDAQYPLAGTNRGITLEAFVDMVHGDIGEVPALNCDDCAFSVTALSNILGCRTQCIEFEAPSASQLETRPFIPLGRPFIGSGFSNHVVSVNAATNDYLVYDASIKLKEIGGAAFDVPIGWELRAKGGYLDSFLTETGKAAVKISEAFAPQAKVGIPTQTPAGSPR